MIPEVVQQLLALNRAFYRQLADPFAETRAHPQPGFARLLEWRPQPCRTVLDVGCGNGRFGHFLSQRLPIEYVGVDFTPELLQKGELLLPAGRYLQRDMSQSGFLRDLPHFDLVVCLAAMQHVPGYENRRGLLQEMAEHKGENGRIFLANWQFMDSARQRRKVRPWSEIGLQNEDVGPNDYLLTWQRDGFGLRYVCQVDEAETKRLAHDTGLAIRHQFRSDGKEGNLSLYSVLS